MAIKKYSDYAKENNIEYKVNHIGNVSQYLKQKSSQSVKKEETKRKWLNKGSFNDGYQFGDITKTTAGTVGDIGTNLLKGVVKAGESIGDLAAYGGAQIVDWFGADNYAKEVRKAAAESLTDKLFSKVDKVVDKNSVLGEKSDNVVESIGNMYAQGVTSNKLLGTKGNIPLNVAGKKFNLPATSVISGASAGMSEAVNKDAEDWQIWLNGIKSGVTEGVSESLFGTFGIGGSDLDDAIVKGITKNMENGLAKTLAKSGIKAIGEGTEEIVSYLLDYASSHIGDYAKNTLKLKGPDLAEKFSSEELWESFFAGTLAAGFGGLPSTINSIKGNTTNLNVNEGINQFNKVNLPGLNQNIKPNLPINSLGQQPTTNTNNIYQFEKSNNLKVDNLKASASKYFNNSSQTHNFINNLEKIVSDKNYNVVFDDTIKNNNGNVVNAQIKTLDNGETEIRLNPNSERSGEFLIMHEVTHAIETDAMKQLVLNYASKHSDFNDALDSLKQTYGVDDVTSEVVADISGQLFGNQEFINNLSMEQPSVFKRIYDAIVSLANKITGNTRESLFIKDLKNKWESAYRSENNNLNEIQYMMTGIKGVENAIKNDSENQWLKDNYNKAQQLEHNNIDNETIRQRTGWFKDAKGDWKFEISDNEAKIIKKLNRNGIYKLEEILEHSDLYEMYPNLKNVKIKFQNFENVVENNKKYERRGEHNKITGTIALNNVLLTRGNDAVLDTLVHEIQHWVQKKEKFTGGTNPLYGRERYKNHLGEKEARDATNRRKMIYEERIKNLPVSADGKNEIEVSDNKGYNLNEDDYYDEEIKKNLPQSIQNNIYRRGVLGRSEQGLSNSSFSMENNKWQDYLEKNFNANGIRTNMNDIKLPIKQELNPTIPKDPTKASSYEMDDLDVDKIAKILDSKPQTEQQKEHKLKTWATINLIDKGYYIDKVARQYKNRELSAKYDYQLLHNGIANQIIGKGRYDNNGNKIGKSLYEIFEPIENANLVKEFSEYMYHQHNIDRMNLTNTHSEDNKPVFGTPITSEASTKVVKELLEKYPEFEHWAEDIYAYNKANLQMLVDNGVITQEDMDYYNKKYPHYVPIVRDNTNLKNGISFVGNKVSVGVPIKKAKGGNSNLLPLKDAMSIRTMQTTNSALKNDFGMELLNTLYSEEAIKQMQEVKKVDNVIDDIENTEILTKATKDSDATFTIYLNGQKITMPISNEIYEALTPRNVKSFKVLNKLNNIRRALLTEYNPTFMVTNPIKDLQDGSINSKHPALFTKKLPEAIAQITTKGKVLDLYLANGGGQDTYFNYDKGTEHDDGKKYVKTGNKIIDTLKLPLKVLDNISSINQKIEMAPRLAEFMASLEAGDNIQTAMYNAQEITTNFKRGGDVAKMLDKNGFTFLNAGIQGATKQVRNFQDAKVNGLRGIANLAVKFTVWGLGLGMLNDLVWGDDEDYEELQDYVKNNYYIIGKYGDGNFIRIPKGRVVSVIQKLFEDAGNVVTGKEVNGKETLSLIQNQILPSDPSESNLLSPLLQAFGSENGTAWYGGDLIPSRLQNLPEEEQYDESTDKLSIWLGEKLGISPYKINYVLDQYSGVIGDMILPYLTEEAESTTGVLAPLKDKFTVDSTMKSQNVTSFYELKDKLQANSNSYKATTEDKLKYKYINTINNQISKLYAEKRETQVSDMNNKEKYAKVKEIQEQINQLAKNGLENYDDVTSYDNYAKVADKEYFLNSKNEWEKLSKDELEDIEKLKLSNEDKDKYFSAKVKINKISSNKDITSEEKHLKIADELINSSLNEDSIINLYSKKYSTEDKLNYIKALNIPIKKFIELNSQNIESEYNVNTGKTINGSKKQNYIKAVNNLQLSIPQKAILIKMQYPTYNNYNKEIVTYVNKINISKSEKKVLLKAVGFDNYSKEVVNYINSQNITKSEKEKKLKSLGYTIRNGRVYW